MPRRWVWVTATAMAAVTAETAPGDGLWASAPALDAPRFAPGLVLLKNGSAFIAGGTREVNDPNSLKTTLRLDPGSKFWVKSPSMWTARARFGMVRLTDGRLLVAGGQAQGNTLSTAEIIDPDTSKWILVKDMNVPRAFFGLVALPGNKALAVGGMGLDSTVEIFDANVNSWTRVAPLPHPPRYALGATLLQDGRVLVAGGYNNDAGGALDDVHLFSSDTGAWSTSASLAKKRFGLSLVTLPSGLVFAGPGVDNTEIPNTDVEVYTPWTPQWSSGTPIPRGEAFYGLVSHASAPQPRQSTPTVLLVGGRYGYLNTSSTAYTFTPESTDSFRCLDNSCVPAESGVPKASCDKVCGRPTYACVKNRCVQAEGGVAKEVCEKVCRPPHGNTAPFA